MGNTSTIVINVVVVELYTGVVEVVLQIRIIIKVD